MISLLCNSVHTKVSKITEVIPSLPEGFCWLGGNQLPNGDFVLCGKQIMEKTKSAELDECILFENGFNKGRKFGAKKTKIFSSFCMLTTRRMHHDRGLKFVHETFPFVGGVKQKIDVLIELYEYAGTIFDDDKMLISGGCYENVSKKFGSFKLGVSSLVYFLSEETQKFYFSQFRESHPIGPSFALPKKTIGPRVHRYS